MTVSQIRADTTGLRIDKIWSLLTEPAALESWLQADSLQQLDEGDLGRGSCLRAVRNRHAHDYKVTYWEPSKAFVLQRRSPHLCISYHFRARDELDKTRVEITVENDSSGLWRWLAAFIVWKENHRMARYMENLIATLEPDPQQPG
ncbi:MAG: hypothetical protein WD772_09330 [Pseudohongiellaceae bacterium]